MQAIGSQPNKNWVCVFIFIPLYLVKGLYIISIFFKFLFIKHRYIYFSYLFNNVCLNISHQVCCIYHNFGGVLYTIISRYMYTIIWNYEYRLKSECLYIHVYLFSFFFSSNTFLQNPVNLFTKVVNKDIIIITQNLWHMILFIIDCFSYEYLDNY